MHKIVRSNEQPMNNKGPHRLNWRAVDKYRQSSAGGDESALLIGLPHVRHYALVELDQRAAGNTIVVAVPCPFGEAAAQSLATSPCGANWSASRDARRKRLICLTQIVYYSAALLLGRWVGNTRRLCRDVLPVDRCALSAVLHGVKHRNRPHDRTAVPLAALPPNAALAR